MEKEWNTTERMLEALMNTPDSEHEYSLVLIQAIGGVGMYR